MPGHNRQQGGTATINNTQTKLAASPHYYAQIVRQPTAAEIEQANKAPRASSNMAPIVSVLAAVLIVAAAVIWYKRRR
ncbi:MAG: hypothetical protein WAQ57_01255 [Candidatus Saccharimonadales bacterium]